MHGLERGTTPQASSWWSRLKRSARYWYLRVLRQKSTPRQLAFALALGVFIGALPIIPFQSIVIIALAFVFRVNKMVAWLATCYSNAFTMAPFYYVLFLVGDFFLPFEGVRFDPSRLEMAQLLESGWQLFSIILAGGLLLGTPAALGTYFLSHFIICRYRERRALRIMQKQSKQE